MYVHYLPGRDQVTKQTAPSWYLHQCTHTVHAYDSYSYIMHVCHVCMYTSFYQPRQAFHSPITLSLLAVGTTCTDECIAAVAQAW